MRVNQTWSYLSLLLVFFVYACKHSIPYPQDDIYTPPDTIEDAATCDPDTVYFTNDILPLLSSRCAFSGCHDASSREGDVILDSYFNILTTGDVRAHRPDNSDLYEVLLETGEDRMPRLPYEALTAEEIATIGKWIEQGALNNACNECDTTSVTYSYTITKVLQKNCIACHNAQTANGAVQLDHYSAVKTVAENGLLLGVVTHDNGFKPMPPSGVKLSDCHIEQLKQWIDEGAPNN